VLLLHTLLSHYRRHPLQALFLLAGVTVANVLLVGTLLINAQARASYERGEALLSFVPVGQVRHRDAARGFDERIYLRLRLAGFDSLAPVLRRVVTTADGERLELLGIDLFALPRPDNSAQRSWSGGGQSGFADFAFPPYQLWAAPARAEQLGWAEGEQRRLLEGAALPPLVTLPDAQLGHRLLVDVGALQSLTASVGELSSLWVFPTTQRRLQELREALPPELEFVASVDAPDPGELTRSFHLNLAAMGLLTFVVGIFLVYNALAFSYTDRRELIRKLQLAGVTRREMVFALLVELALFLAVGSLAGWWLGAQLAAWLLPGVGQTLAQLYGTYIAYPDGFGLTGFGLPLAMTGLAAGLCALFPLREALNAPLLERSASGWRLQAASRRDLLLAAVGCALLVLAFVTGQIAGSLRPALAGMAFLLVGAVLCLPLALRGLLTLLGRWLPPRFARAGWLLADSRWLLGPASLALMALTLALVANSGLNTMIDSFRQATSEWLDQRLAAQLYLRGDSGPEDLAAWLRARDDRLRLVDRYRVDLQRPAPDGHPAFVEAVTLQPGTRFLESIELLQAEADAFERFDRGEGAFVSERAWRIDGWRPGTRLQLCPDADALPVLGVYHDYGNPRSQWMVAEPLFKRCWASLDPVSLAVYGPANVDWADLRTALVEELGVPEDEVVDPALIKAAGMATFERTFAVTRALNALTLLVAGIGIFCAISAIHHHRVGQQAVLLSLGLTRRERGALLLAQWGLLGILCLLLVWPFGVALAWYLVHVVTPIAFGWSFPLLLQAAPYLALAGVALLALAAAVGLPSLRLLRTTPAAMLREQSL
jgi:putative ABC transport system permease protein